MARKAKPEEIVEPDRLEGQPHPREVFSLVGQGAVLSRLSRAIRAGRPPQGLLISGPPGIGKATLAYRVARYMLRYGATEQGPEDLSVPPNDPVSLQVTAGAHPGLLALKRGLNDSGKLMTVLSVAEIRKLAGFFGMTSGAGGWRVAIIDTADDMNDNAANALLKALEEPPSRAMVMLLANAPGRLLPTIRSRCQRVELKPLDDRELETELAERLSDMGNNERAMLTRLAGGSLGAALALASDDGLAIAADAERLIDNAASPDVAAAFSLADRLGRMTDGTDRFGEFLIQTLTDRIRKRAMSDMPRLDRWTAVLEKLKGSFVRTDALHLDPRQTILSANRALGQTARGRALWVSMLVDSHCHLDFPEFAPELDAVVARAREAGVKTCVSIGTTLEKFPGVLAVAERFENVWCSVGIHPHEAEPELLKSPAPLIEHGRHPKVVGIGETGLDFYYNHSPREPQIANFRAHIAAARELKLPCIVHTRNADAETVEILRDEMGKGAFTGLIHCFTGTQMLADAALEMGFCISVSGIATFKKSDELRDVLKTVPLDRLLVETDAPYLAPMPYRGKRNEPSFVVNTAAMLAELKGVSAEELARATTDNFFRLFTKAKRPA